MNRRMSGAALEFQRELDKILYPRIVRDGGFQLRHHFQCLGYAYVSAADRWRDQLSDLFHVAVRHIQSASDILYRCSRCHRSKRNDLADRLTAIDLGDMIDHVGATADTEIDIDVRH